jgi:hypothetical protein
MSRRHGPLSGRGRWTLPDEPRQEPPGNAARQSVVWMTVAWEGVAWVLRRVWQPLAGIDRRIRETLARVGGRLRETLVGTGRVLGYWDDVGEHGGRLNGYVSAGK